MDEVNVEEKKPKRPRRYYVLVSILIIYFLMIILGAIYYFSYYFSNFSEELICLHYNMDGVPASRTDISSVHAIRLTNYCLVNNCDLGDIVWGTHRADSEMLNISFGFPNGEVQNYVYKCIHRIKVTEVKQ